MSTALANCVTAVTELFRESQLVFPANFNKRLFTTAAVDNIDHNSSSITAIDPFHGTGISLFQHPNPESEEEDGVAEHVISANKEAVATYANVPLVMCKKVESPAPQNVRPTQDNDLFHEALRAEHR